MAKPMRYRSLLHEIEYHAYDSTNEWGESYEAPVTIRKVRVDDTFRFNRYSNTETLASACVIFIDRIHSKPILEWKEKSKIVFEGKEMTLKVVEAIYTNSNQVHHWELTCV